MRLNDLNILIKKGERQETNDSRLPHALKNIAHISTVRLTKNLMLLERLDSKMSDNMTSFAVLESKIETQRMSSGIQSNRIMIECKIIEHKAIRHGTRR